MFIFSIRKLVLFFIFWLGTKYSFATEANFILHRIRNQVGWDGRVFDIEFSNGGPLVALATPRQADTEGPLIIGGGCAFVTKFRAGREERYGLSALEIRSKNF
jgi:hypothetical protein